MSRQHDHAQGLAGPGRRRARRHPARGRRLQRARRPDAPVRAGRPACAGRREVRRALRRLDGGPPRPAERRDRRRRAQGPAGRRGLQPRGRRRRRRPAGLRRRRRPLDGGRRHRRGRPPPARRHRPRGRPVRRLDRPAPGAPVVRRLPGRRRAAPPRSTASAARPTRPSRRTGPPSSSPPRSPSARPRPPPRPRPRRPPPPTRWPPPSRRRPTPSPRRPPPPPSATASSPPWPPPARPAPRSSAPARTSSTSSAASARRPPPAPPPCARSSRRRPPPPRPPRPRRPAAGPRHRRRRRPRRRRPPPPATTNPPPVVTPPVVTPPVTPPPRRPTPTASAPAARADRPPAEPQRSPGRRRRSGCPYIWGGVGPDGYDCSGLSMGAWRTAGVNLARTTRDQYKQVLKISYNDLRPGDLVFWSTDPNNPDAIYHVAIWAGDGQIMEASKPGDPLRTTVDALGQHDALRRPPVTLPPLPQRPHSMRSPERRRVADVARRYCSAASAHSVVRTLECADVRASERGGRALSSSRLGGAPARRRRGGAAGRAAGRGSGRGAPCRRSARSRCAGGCRRSTIGPQVTDAVDLDDDAPSSPPDVEVRAPAVELRTTTWRSGSGQTAAAAHAREVELVERADTVRDVEQHRPQQRPALVPLHPVEHLGDCVGTWSVAAGRGRRAAAPPRDRSVPTVPPARSRPPAGCGGSPDRTTSSSRQRRVSWTPDAGRSSRSGGTTSARRRGSARRRRRPRDRPPAAP